VYIRFFEGIRYLYTRSTFACVAIADLVIPTMSSLVRPNIYITIVSKSAYYYLL